jgi:RNA polymerase sigma-70 factor (ECF subfamily)
VASAANPNLSVVAAPPRPSAQELEAQAVELYRAHAAGLYRYAVALARDHELAEDSIQETFLRYFLTRKEGRTVANPRAWLYQVLRNLLLDDRKRLGIRASSGLDAALSRVDHEQDPEQRLRGEELSRQLRASLSAREFECLQLRAEGLDYREIAGVLRIRIGTVGVLLARGLKKTQRVLDRRGEGR